MSGAPLTVYYDASCAMCAEEMRALREAAGDGGLRMVDCSRQDFDASALAGQGVERADLMRRLHARNADGRWFVALDAYEAVYARAGYARAARVWGSILLRPLLEPAYLWVARHRQKISLLGAHRVFAWILRR